jgi:hypothetical protein
MPAVGPDDFGTHLVAQEAIETAVGRIDCPARAAAAPRELVVDAGNGASMTRTAETWCVQIARSVTPSGSGSASGTPSSA